MTKWKLKRNKLMFWKKLVIMLCAMNISMIFGLDLGFKAFLSVGTELKRKRTVMGEFKKLVDNNSAVSI